LDFEKAKKLGFFTRISNLLCAAHASIMAAYRIYGGVDYLLSEFGGRKNEIAREMNVFEKAFTRFINFWTGYYAHGGAGREVNEETEIYISFNSPSTFTPFTIKQAGSGHIDLQVYHNEPLKLNVTPDNGWVINSVTVNGIDITKKLDGNGDFTIYRVNGGIVVGSAPNRVPIPSSAVSTAGDELTTFVAFEKSTDSVNELFSTGTIKVYGSEGQLRIEGVNKGETVRVYDTAGRLVAQTTGDGGWLTINVPSGIYLVQSGNTTIKIII
jgi:hypothetical protein